ncbi:hypothetical protein CFN78_27335 [Amycolatopsis antarctica]|uniref:ESX-1 secretion-associated protein n=1 Tax=Amycolatopsis antarctica TaxID=1854586 RepID=A0A263CXA2_9PSEU|nr:type VII secretion target [Amycolatopsis antarctica]OZM70047.1 hypothetical protein CFN78_27335 [Amycolatopsis antarctica]
MSGFEADAKVIGEFGEKLDGLGSDAKEAKTYAEDYLQASRGESGIFQTIVGVLDDARETLGNNYERLRKLQEAAATEVDRAAMMYDDTDKAAAERIDGTYPGAGE